MIEVTGEYPQNLVLDYVAERIGTQADQLQPAVGVAVLQSGKIIGGVVFNNYHKLKNGSWCELSAATDDPSSVSRKVLRVIFGYPFIQLGVSRLKAECSTANERCRSFLVRLGFVLEGISRKAYDGAEDSCVYSMLPSECRWLGEKSMIPLNYLFYAANSNSATYDFSQPPPDSSPYGRYLYYQVGSLIPSQGE